MPGYTPYSKAFAKKAVDLNKNDFKGDDKYKMMAKGKMASGISFAAEGSDKASDGKYTDAKIEITMPVDDKFKVTLETTAGQKTTVTADMAVMSGASLKLIASDPDLSNPTAMGLKGEFNYAEPSFSCETKFCLWDGPAVGKIAKNDKGVASSPFFHTGSHGVQAGFAFDLPGMDKVTLGLMPGIGFNNKGAIGFQMPVSVGWAGKDMSLAFVTGGLLASYKATDKDGKESMKTKPDLACAGIKGHFKLSDDLLFAFEADQTFYKLDQKALWTTKNADAKKESQVFKAGLQYSASKDTTYKMKGTFDKKAGLDLDFSVKTALAGKNSVLATCKVPYAKDAAPSVGIQYNLEA